jgi:hypothetical protein
MSVVINRHSDTEAVQHFLVLLMDSHRQMVVESNVISNLGGTANYKAKYLY